MAIPKYDEMYKEVLEVLKDCEPHKASSIRDCVANILNISDDERKILLPSGKQPLFNSRVNWTCVYLKKAGLITNYSRGIYILTDSGKELLHKNPNKIDNNYLLKYDSFSNYIKQSNNAYKSKHENDSIDTNSEGSNSFIEDLSQTPQDTLDEAYAKINSTLADDVLCEVMNQSPIFFEHLVVKLLTKMGYGGTLEDAGFVTKASGDEGIDGIIKEDKLGFSKIYIQAKRWNKDNPVGRQELQSFVGALIGQGANKGLFITTGRFTKGAKEYAEKQLQTNIILIDGEKLAKLMIEYNVGVSVEATYEIKRIDSDFFDDDLN